MIVIPMKKPLIEPPEISIPLTSVHLSVSVREARRAFAIDDGVSPDVVTRRRGRCHEESVAYQNYAIGLIGLSLRCSAMREWSMFSTPFFLVLFGVAFASWRILLFTCHARLLFVELGMVLHSTRKMDHFIDMRSSIKIDKIYVVSKRCWSHVCVVS